MDECYVLAAKFRNTEQLWNNPVGIRLVPCMAYKMQLPLTAFLHSMLDEMVSQNSECTNNVIQNVLIIRYGSLRTTHCYLFRYLGLAAHPRKETGEYDTVIS